MNTAKVFMNGRSQAIRLPREYRVKGKEVYLRRTREGILLTEQDPWETSRQGCGELSPEVLGALAKHDRVRGNGLTTRRVGIPGTHTNGEQPRPPLCATIRFSRRFATCPGLGKRVGAASHHSRSDNRTPENPTMKTPLLTTLAGVLLAAALPALAATTTAPAPRIAGEYLADFAPPGEVVPPMWAAFTADGKFLLVSGTGSYSTGADGDISIHMGDEPALRGKLNVTADLVKVTGRIEGNDVVQNYHRASACPAPKQRLQGQWENIYKPEVLKNSPKRLPDLTIKGDHLEILWMDLMASCVISEGVNGKPTIATDKEKGRSFELHMFKDTLVVWERGADRKVQKEWGFVRFKPSEAK